MYFLLVYDQLAGKLLECREFAGHDREEALRACFAREHETMREPHIEVVLLGAESLEAVRQTHARYFQSPAEIVAASMHRL
jgi:hypothetical protein